MGKFSEHSKCANWDPDRDKATQKNCEDGNDPDEEVGPAKGES